MSEEKKGTLYLETPRGWVEWGRCNHDTDVYISPTDKIYIPLLFQGLHCACRYCHPGYDIDRNVHDYCHHPENKPGGREECSLESCPLWKPEKEENT